MASSDLKNNFDKQNIYLYSIKKTSITPFFVPEKIYKINSIDDFDQAYKDKKISKKTAFLEEKKLINQTNAGKYKVKQIKFSDQEISLTGEFDKETFFVFNKNYDPEWQIYIDGKRVSIVKTNITQIGVFIPQGTHTVILKYENKMFKIGVIISTVYLVILLEFCLKKSENIS